MRKVVLSLFITAALCGLTATAQNVQLGPAAAPSMNSHSNWVFGTTCAWDNGDTDGTGGISHLSDPLPRRTVLEDFEVGPGGQCYSGVSMFFIWNTRGPGSGTDMNVWFREDNAGSPGAIMFEANTTGYSDVATGRVWFGREEAKIHASFDSDVCLDEGIFWVEKQVIGPENGFQMVQVNNPLLQPLWVDYADYGGLQSGRNIFGVDWHASFCLTGRTDHCHDTCDINCDGGIDAFDIEPFLDLLFGPDPQPCCDGTGDVNGDGVVDAFDIEPFLDCLFP